MESSKTSSQIVSGFRLPDVPVISAGNPIVLHNPPQPKNLNVKPLNRIKQNRDSETLIAKQNNRLNNKIVDDRKLCTSCSKIVMKTIKPIEICIQKLYNMVDNQVLMQHRNEINKNNKSKHPIQQKKSAKTSTIQTDQRETEPDSISFIKNKELEPKIPLIEPSNYQSTLNTRNDLPAIFARQQHENGNHSAEPNLEVNEFSENLSDYVNYPLHHHHQHQQHQEQHQQELPKNSNYNGNNLQQDSRIGNWSQQSSGSTQSIANHVSCAELLGESLKSLEMKIHEHEQEEIEEKDDHTIHRKEQLKGSDGESYVGTATDNPDHLTESNQTESIFRFNQKVIDNYHQSNPSTTDVSAIRKSKDQDGLQDSKSFAYITIINNNLGAINAIILANSIEFYDNVHLEQKNDYRIPLLALFIGEQCVDHDLRSLVGQFYDRIIDLNPSELVLLNDESLGIQHHKVHLWKVLAGKYSKCIFLDTNTMVVGKISNLFNECDELSASVDCFFPDYFNCSMFLFEPNEVTYKNLIQYGVGQGNSFGGIQINNDSDNNESIPSGIQDTVDEITLLNEYFATKWHKLSFIYNFVQNDSSYTQHSAYLKFGENVRVVNFKAGRAGRTAGTGVGFQFENQEKFSSEPWHYRFDLNNAIITTNNKEPAFQHDPIDNFSKFYLLLFVRRLWPLLSQKMLPLMLSSPQYSEGVQRWSVYDLIQIINRQQQQMFGNNANNGDNGVGGLFDQNTFTLHSRMIPKMETADRFNNISVQSSTERKEATIEATNQSEPISVTRQIDDNENDCEDSILIDDHGMESKDGEPLDDEQQKVSINKQIQLTQQDWERGQIDWMHQYQSDKIIDRLKAKFI